MQKVQTSCFTSKLYFSEHNIKKLSFLYSTITGVNGHWLGFSGREEEASWKYNSRLISGD